MAKNCFAWVAFQNLQFDHIICMKIQVVVNVEKLPLVSCSLKVAGCGGWVAQLVEQAYQVQRLQSSSRLSWVWFPVSSHLLHVFPFSLHPLSCQFTVHYMPLVPKTILFFFLGCWLQQKVNETAQNTGLNYKWSERTLKVRLTSREPSTFKKNKRGKKEKKGHLVSIRKIKWFILSILLAAL